jgi:hypothetical protein
LAPVRIVATVGALFIMTPAYAAPALMMPANPELTKAWSQADSCTERSQIEKLDTLPASNLAVPLDITPALLASSHHRAIASGYHRNNDGIHDVIVTFAGPLSSARQVIRKRDIDYVVMCRGAVESIRWGNCGPGGLASLLNEDRPPEWLAPVVIPGLKGLHVWRVRKSWSLRPPDKSVLKKL